VPQTRRIETTLAPWSLLAGLVANFAGFMLIGRLAWPLCLALIAFGTSGLIGAMLLVAAAIGTTEPRRPHPPPAPQLTSNLPPNGVLLPSRAH
jgi:hypothetical protein